ncbi:MAG: S-layer homology domain-containing protein, partial [Oscillospiraceae bacterium]|nr:S-layer homology domain-containing protein [Oscillospiraceae bacterium]
ITSGTSATTFSPNQNCTRAQFVTFLWRIKGQPEPSLSESPFKDVRQGTWYYKAVLWAVEDGITAGSSATTFSPNNDCSRAQVVTFLWRMAGCEEPTLAENPFTDVAEGRWYAKAVLWAFEHGITAGTSATTFSPTSACTRAQCMTFLFRQFAE